jgi:hypothetical protein
MGAFGPPKKSAEMRIREGERAHRPLPPAPAKYVPGMPERPKGMTASARRIWDAYMVQLAPLGILRPLDGFALRRLCEDVALLQELQQGSRKMARARKREAKIEGRKIAGGAMAEFSMSPEGRRLSATINSLASRIKRDELQFGLTPVASLRLEGRDILPGLQVIVNGMDAVEAALCG